MSISVPRKVRLPAAPCLDQRVSQRLDFPKNEACQNQKSTDPQVDRCDRASVKEMTDQHQGAVTDLYERYGEILHSAVRQVVKEETQVETVVQEVFLQLYRDAVRESFDRGMGARSVLPLDPAPGVSVKLMASPQSDR